VLVAGFCALALAACANNNKKKPRLAYEERPVELLYATGADRLDRHLWSQAVDYFQEVERQHPYSEWSRRAILMQAYAHYEANNYPEAVGDADRFISLYPGNPAAAYAHYLRPSATSNRSSTSAATRRPPARRWTTCARSPSATRGPNTPPTRG
jgi:outer membrane protein assembly factor BamD